MLKNSSKLLFLTTLIMSTILVISSNNWFSLWMGLEINLISFIPIMSYMKNNFSAESCMLYFLVQSMSSVLFLFFILLSITLLKMNNILIETLIMSSMMIKMGSAPFHFWLPEIMEKMNWVNCMILMTWQKIAPMTILSYLSQNNKLLLIAAMTGTVIGAMGGINQTSIRKIMAYSSIAHLGWMLACMTMENEMWIYYLMIYSFIVIMLSNMFNYKSILYMNQLNFTSKSMMEKITYLILLLSLGGLPPFLGFLPKWMVIQSLMNNQMYLTLTVLVMTTLITLFYYLRMSSTMIMMNSSINKWNTLSYNNNKLLMINITVNFMLPMMSFLV
uniref:NADH-ubiquinone oxidoreductase chain 2 n=1 Tax=Aphelocheirus jendeki TaxID=2021939 RepID=A0A343ISA0_9HEMI|nr:NADH dehydrogenase subunit 2 [Aphelocheirus jendeki]AST10099.1 NADH dehydrogenase subunit 2 [Aphelocheirus jendeki]